MSSHSFTTNVRVALKSETVPLKRGTVVGPAKQQQSGLGVPLDAVVVDWDDGAVQKVTVRSLMLESEAAAEEARLTQQAEKLEEEFDAVAQRIAAKMAEAAKLINESASLAEQAGTDLQSLYEENRPLMRALDNAGWSTSSMSC